jgi:hypothetical protein
MVKEPKTSLPAFIEMELKLIHKEQRMNIVGISSMKVETKAHHGWIQERPIKQVKL